MIPYKGANHEETKRRNKTRHNHTNTGEGPGAPRSDPIGHWLFNTSNERANSEEMANPAV